MKIRENRYHLIVSLNKHFFSIIINPNIRLHVLQTYIFIVSCDTNENFLNVMQYCVTIEHFFVDLDKIRCILDPILSMWKCSLHISFGWHEN